LEWARPGPQAPARRRRASTKPIRRFSAAGLEGEPLPLRLALFAGLIALAFAGCLDFGAAQSQCVAMRGCGFDGGVDAGRDAAISDGGTDAATDSGPAADAGLDAGFDAGICPGVPPPPQK